MPDIEDMTAQEAEIARLEAELANEGQITTDEEPPKIEEPQEPIEKLAPVVEEQPEPEEEKEPAKDDHAAWARLRRERAEEKKRADELAAKLAAIEAAKLAQPEPKKEVAQAPDPNVDPEGFLAWKIQENDKTIAELKAKVEARENQDKQATQYNAAIQEFSNIINDYKQKQPDFTQASDFLEAEMRKAVRLQNPTIPSAQIQAVVNNQILKIASEFAKQGLNPAEEFYSMAHEFGYKKPVTQPTVQPPSSQKPKVNLNAVEKTKQRSVSGLQSSGASASAGIGLDALSGMSVQDFARLSPEQLRDLESQSYNS